MHEVAVPPKGAAPLFKAIFTGQQGYLELRTASAALNRNQPSTEADDDVLKV